MASLSERIPTPSSFERTSNIVLAIAGAFLIGVIVWFATENQIYTVAAALIVGYLLLGVRIVRPTHRVLIELLGKFQRFGGPGFYWVLPGFQKLYAVNITEKMVNATRQEIITADNLNATVDAQVYFKVKDDELNVKRSQYNVYNYEEQIVNLARTTLRNIIGTLSLKSANSERSRINDELGKVLKTETQSWGIEIVRTELKEIMPPPDVQDTMNKVVKAENEKIAAIDFATARETEADGLRRAAIKQAEGVKQAKILEAEGQAEAIRLVNEAADRFFIGNAQKLKSLEVTESALKTNTKIVLPEGQQIVNVIGELAGSQMRQE
ncbi:MAG: SPFH/Band 7/PHB domain protein [Methanoregulaceae archaeon]|jgi:regulator of protease activity HflC (stomatin/prohibitin superfamily)|nr:SPFH/Band 7/PHB domain protein [Methanoregulaceae archaeon]